MTVHDNLSMPIYHRDQVDPSLDHQLVDCGGGLLETFAVVEKTGSFQIGEIALRTIQAKIEYLSDDRVQQLVQSYCDDAALIRAEQIRQRLQFAD